LLLGTWFGDASRILSQSRKQPYSFFFKSTARKNVKHGRDSDDADIADATEAQGREMLSFVIPTTTLPCVFCGGHIDV
jgi:hypothetical protein